MNLSSALVYSTRPPVSVYGTGAYNLMLRRFSRWQAYRLYWIVRRRSILSGFGSEDGFAYLPHNLLPLNGQFRLSAGVSLPRLSIAAVRSGGILTASSIAFPSRVAA